MADIWLTEDVRNALLAINEASSAAAAAAQGGLDPPVLWAYRRGYMAALGAVAIAFGISPQAIAGLPLTTAQDSAPADLLVRAGKVEALDELERR